MIQKDVLKCTQEGYETQYLLANSLVFEAICGKYDDLFTEKSARPSYLDILRKAFIAKILQINPKVEMNTLNTITLKSDQELEEDHGIVVDRSTLLQLLEERTMDDRSLDDDLASL